MSDIQEQIKLAHKRAEENDIKLLKEEIKEILDYLKIENGTIGSELSYEETHLLLDYITNLQEENKKIKKYYNVNVNKYEDLLIKYNTIERWYQLNKSREDLLNKLQGVDKE